MTRTASTPGARPSATEFRAELLGRLGLRPDANEQEIESAYREVVDFLDGAPEAAKPWAEHATRDAEEAFTLLSLNPQQLKAAARYAAPAAGSAFTPPAAAAGAPAARPGGRLPWVLVGLLVAVGAIFGIYKMGASDPAVPTMTSADSASAASTAQASPTLDAAKLADLMAKVAKNPKDVVSLQSISNVYFEAANYATAAEFAGKVVAVDPKNKTGLLSLGASQFNAGDKATAEKTWLKAAALYPENQEVHYDLWFYYMTTNETAKMTAQRDKVLAIDPNTDLAKMVSQHMGSAKPSSTATASPSATATK